MYKKNHFFFQNSFTKNVQHQDEEIREIKFFHEKQKEVEDMEAEIRHKTEAHSKASGGLETEATCRLCLKTKFADGIGHLCNYCR